MTTLTLNEAADFLRQGDNFLILTHGRPDGDTIGSGSALCRLLRGLGKQTFLLSNEDLTPRLGFLCGDLLAPEGFVPEAVVATDVATRALLCKNAASFGDRVDLSIDHHRLRQKHPVGRQLCGHRRADLAAGGNAGVFSCARFLRCCLHRHLHRYRLFLLFQHHTPDPSDRRFVHGKRGGFLPPEPAAF